MLKLEPLEIYDIILRSSVVLAFNSSVRCEALMLKKIAMTCNYTGYENDYVVNNSCDDVVINSDKYNLKLHKIFLFQHMEKFENLHFHFLQKEFFYYFHKQMKMKLE